MRWNGTEWVELTPTPGGGAMSLADLADVDIAGANPDDALVKDADNIWRAKHIEGAAPAGEWVLVGSTKEQNAGVNIGTIELPAHQAGDVLVIAVQGSGGSNYGYKDTDGWVASYGAGAGISTKVAESATEGPVTVTYGNNNDNYPLTAIAASFRFVGGSGSPVLGVPAAASTGYITAGDLTVFIARVAALVDFTAAPDGFTLGDEIQSTAYAHLTAAWAWGVSPGAIDDITFTHSAGTTEALRVATATGG